MDYIDDPTPLLIKKTAYGSIRFQRIWLSQLEKIDRSIEEKNIFLTFPITSKWIHMWILSMQMASNPKHHVMES